MEMVLFRRLGVIGIDCLFLYLFVCISILFYIMRRKYSEGRPSLKISRRRGNSMRNTVRTIAVQ